MITRHDLDAIVNERAAKAGATVWQGTEAVEPILGRRIRTPAPDRGAASCPSCVGAVVQGQGHRRRPARSGPGTWWWPTGPTRGSAGPSGPPGTGASPWAWPCAGYYTSPGHDQPFIESHLDIRDGDGKVVPGYGWIFPLGDGRVNVGVGLLSTDRRWKGVNTSTLMEHFVAWAPKEWELSPATCLGPPTGGKLPMGLSVGPRVGRHHPGGGRRRRVHQPVQRRGHRLRLRDRPPGRRVAGRGPVAATGRRPSTATRTGSRTPTASTTGWPGPSSG